MKKYIALLLVLCITASTFPASAAGIGIKDYRDIKYFDTNKEPVEKPTAQFSITINGQTTPSPDGVEINDNMIILYAKVGDVAVIKDLSHSNRGMALKSWNFQAAKPNGSASKIYSSRSSMESDYSNFVFSVAGTYTFDLCVRDTIENEAWTGYWGNWSDNGNHQVIGHNPGSNLSDPSDDFDGYWYFTRVRVVAQNTLPEAEFDIEHNNTVVTDNTSRIQITDDIAAVPQTIHLVDKSTISEGSIVSWQWYYWDISSGWKQFSTAQNPTYNNVNRYDWTVKLITTSDKGATDYAFHMVYFQKLNTSVPTPPPGSTPTPEPTPTLPPPPSNSPPKLR